RREEGDTWGKNLRRQTSPHLPFSLSPRLNNPQSAYVRLRRRAYANIEQLFCERQSNEIFKGCWMKNVYLAGAVRTPIGRYGGALAGLSPAALGAIGAAERWKRARVEPGDVRECLGR